MAQSIFITGGASGIGRAVAVYFAQRGWLVGLADVNEAGLVETADMLPEGQSSIHRLDVRDRKAWAEALRAFTAKTGGLLHVLFNNAGVARGGAFADCSPADHDILIDVNFKGVILGAEAAFPYLKATPGSALLNTASASGIYGTPGMATYSATKFGVRGLSEALDIEWAEHGVRVRCLLPGFIDTPLLSIIGAGSNQSARESVVESGLEFTPLEIVAEIAWNAVHEGRDVHYPVGKTAKRLRFMSRWAPGMLRKFLMKQAPKD